MLYIIFLSLSYSIIPNPSNFVIAQSISPIASAEESARASTITKYAKQKIDKCYENLGKTMTELCINLDVEKRIRLAISIMICEQARDGRSGQLPTYKSDIEFISELDSECFNIFTIYFINIDTICFHAAHENVTSTNIQRIMSVFQAVSLSTEFLNTARKNLDELMWQVRLRFLEYQKLFEEEQKKFQSIQGSIVQMIQTVKVISEKALYYRSIATNAKFYLTFIGLAFVISFVLPNVFLPIIFIVGVFLMIECSASDNQLKYTTHYLYKWCFVFVCLVILSISSVGKIKCINKKKLKKSRKQRMNCPLTVSKSLIFEKPRDKKNN